MALRLSYTEFRIKQFGNQQLGPGKLTFGMPGQEKIDETEPLILKGLSKPGSSGNNEMAMRFGIALSTCHARVQRFQKAGVIVGSSFVVDFSKVGIQAYSPLLKTRTHSAALRAEASSGFDSTGKAKKPVAYPPTNIANRQKY